MGSLLALQPGETFSSVLKSIKLYPFMKKDFIQSAGAIYEAPECSIIAFGHEGVLCSSGDDYGDAGEAGSDGSYHDNSGELY